jgi:hypothetical protein
VLVGVTAYGVLVDAFNDAGCRAEVATPPPTVRCGVDVLSAFRAAVVRSRPDLVVAHSNAGLVAPAAAAGAPVVFVDAALPPCDGPCTMAPAPMMARLTSLADPAGMLPPWTMWWDESDVAPLFPDARTRHLVEGGQPRLPLAYFRSEVEAPAGWEKGPHGYVAFGETYAAELARARGLGWPTRAMDGAGHLHHLHDPRVVAREVLALAQVARGADRDDASTLGPV